MPAALHGRARGLNMPAAPKRKTAPTRLSSARDAMLDFLFRRLTAEPERGAALFDAVTGIAREPHWYVEGQVPDTLDGRFAVLATVTALVLVRLEADGETGDAVSVALTERFIEVMESRASRARARRSDARQDGAQARRLARAADGAVAFGGRDPRRATRESLYKDDVPTAMRWTHSARALERLRSQLDNALARPTSRKGGSNERPLRASPPTRPDPRRRAARPCRRRSASGVRSPSGSGSARSDRLEAHASLSRTGPLVRAEGRIVASLEQSCVVTGEPVAGACRRAVRADCSCPNRRTPEPDEEIELGEEDCDVVFYDGGRDRPRQRDRRHAGAQPRSLSAQRRRRRRAQGGGRAERGAGEPVRRAGQS